MKVNGRQVMENSSFEPVRLEIELQSEAETKVFYSIFNTPPITDTAQELGLGREAIRAIRQAIQDQVHRNINDLNPSWIEWQDQMASHPRIKRWAER